MPTAVIVRDQETIEARIPLRELCVWFPYGKGSLYADLMYSSKSGFRGEILSRLRHKTIYI